MNVGSFWMTNTQTYKDFSGICLCLNISILKDFTKHLDGWLFAQSVEVTYLNSEHTTYLTSPSLA